MSFAVLAAACSNHVVSTGLSLGGPGGGGSGATAGELNTAGTGTPPDILLDAGGPLDTGGAPGGGVGGLGGLAGVGGATSGGAGAAGGNAGLGGAMSEPAFDPCEGLACGADCDNCELGTGCTSDPGFCQLDGTCAPAIPGCGSPPTCASVCLLLTECLRCADDTCATARGMCNDDGSCAQIDYECFDGSTPGVGMDYDPCFGRVEGQMCNLCAPDDPTCVETGVVKQCQNGVCAPMTGQVCAAQSQSCALGQTCCPGLTCCSGVPVIPGAEFCGAICPISDKNLKQDFVSVDPDAVLQKVNELPISFWSYKTEPDKRHIGPMAQDFMSHFEVGSSDRTILQVDGDGVALAAIQALSRRVEQLEAQNQELMQRLEGAALSCEATSETAPSSPPPPAR